MAPKVGHRGYLHLAETFDAPRWRESFILAVEGNWLRMAVRCSTEELARTELTPIELDDATFCMVEAEAHLLRAGAPADAMLLQMDNKKLLEAGKKALETGDEGVFFATASEPGVTQAKGKSKAAPRRKDSQATPTSSGSSQEDEEDILAQMRRSWLGGGTAEGKKKTKSKSKRSGRRFTLIEKSKKTEEKSALSTSALLEAAAQSSDPLKGLLALQIAQVSKRDRKTRRKKSSDSESLSSSSGSSDERSSSGSRSRSPGRGYSKAIKGYQASGKRMFRKPLRHVKRYIRTVEAELGAEDRPYRLVDYNRRIHFGKQQNLKRCHYLASVVLELLLKEKFKAAALQLVLALQAMRQAALDGSWDVAWMLTYVEDPFKPRTFGGDPTSLQHVTSYLKSMGEFARSTQALQKKGNSKGDDDATSQKETQKGKGRGGGNHKQKEKDKDKTATE